MHESTEDIQNRELAIQRLSREGRKYFRFIEFDANEELVTEIRKHPFGLMLVFITGGFVMLATLLATGFLMTADFDSFLGTGNVNDFKPVLVLLALLVLLGTALFTFIGAFLYRSNVIFVTSEKIAQVLYTSIFHKKISQLSIGDVQDVTVSQNGVFAHAFNYGTLVIETAGEQQNYTFTYVPDPYAQSKAIVGAHERNLVQHGN